jgi:imidazole glycerol-phosphate synthase subunit HisF
MHATRIIARLDIKGPNLVKGIHLEGLRVLGKPEAFARYYYETGADELMYVDVVASLYNRSSFHEIITRTAKEVFIPLTVGGGLRTIEDIRDVLRAGADKVSLNTAAIANPDIVKSASRIFGSSTIAVTIEAIRQPDGRYLAYTDNGREHTGVEVCAWARRVEELGAGEIVLTSVDREGTGEGYDLHLVRTVAASVSIPVVAHGGCGCADHVVQVVRDGLADAVAVASVVHYERTAHAGASGDYTAEGNLEFLKSGRPSTKLHPCTIGDIKRRLVDAKLECRGPVCHPNQ